MPYDPNTPWQAQWHAKALRTMLKGTPRTGPQRIARWIIVGLTLLLVAMLIGSLIAPIFWVLFN
jgi:hypothetical protein